jgi:hypothetical protein
VKQLWEQKEEIANETAAIIAKLGLRGRLHSYLSVGDCGKMVLPLKHALGELARGGDHDIDFVSFP